ncbi:hypothetical protein KO498_16370 [Lentibacter algarum]|uniref:hypothetical protein n=1 Tax=Lentibacter algarum TaxID=576131 RepID=UPI001C0966C8|nr:hypothetical protein [Lentibacter algarum]MBU2983382.1 hypothetical protein [Lentibacter algarum]
MTTVDMNTKPAPAWLKVIAALGVVWYAFGLLQMWLGVTLDTGVAVAAGQMTAGHAAAHAGVPGFVWASFAVASGAGLVGAALLFMGRGAAFAAFAISLISAAVYYGYIYVISGTASARPTEEAIIAVVVVSVTIGFTLLSRRFR